MNVSQASLIILKSLPKKSRKKKLYFCPECPKVCNDSSNLKRHIRSNHEKAKVACDECGEWYKVDWIKKHKETHSGREKILCPFDGCDNKYSLKSSH